MPNRGFHSAEVHARVKPRMAQALDRLAEQAEMTRAEAVREAIAQWIARQTEAEGAAV